MIPATAAFSRGQQHAKDAPAPYKPLDGCGDRVVQKQEKIIYKTVSARMEWESGEGGFGLLLGDGLVIDQFLTSCLQDQLQIGDRIVRVSGVSVRSFDDLEEFIQTRPSSWLNIEVVRAVPVNDASFSKKELYEDGKGGKICGVYGRGRTMVMHSMESEC